MIKTMAIMSILVLTGVLLACGGGGGESESDSDTVPTKAPSTGSTRATTEPGTGTDDALTVVGECTDGLKMQPGEGCQFNGDEGRPADVVISVGAQGEICREKGSVMMSGFTVGVIQACGDRFEIVDVFEAEIDFVDNGDGSWTVTTP